MIENRNYSKEEKFSLIKAFEHLGREEYSALRDEQFDPDNTRNEREIDNEWCDWLANDFEDRMSGWLEEKKVRNMAYFISNEYWDWKEDGSIENFFKSYQLEPFDLVKFIVRAIILFDEDVLEVHNIESIQDALEEMLGEEDIKFSDELINSEFIKAYDLISELD